MANTYTQSAVHTVFAVKNRQALIHADFREELQKYFTGILANKGHKMMAVYAMPDHVHVLMAISMKMAPCDIMKVLKGDSSEWINRQNFTPQHFQWQRGYGWFHVDKRGIDALTDYIRHQPERHGRNGLVGEYTNILKENGVDFDPEYIFEEPE